MEIIHSEPINLERVADLCVSTYLNRPPLTPRDRTIWHVSNLLKSGHLITKGDTRYHEFEGEPSGIMSMGRIWESVVDTYLYNYAVNKSGLYVPDYEITKDDILGSLDGLMCLPDYDKVLVCECKLRFTLRDEIPLDHLQQIRAYCHLLDTDLACYVTGHITTAPPTVQAMMRIIRFTKQAIEETWLGIVNTKNYLVSCNCLPGAKQ